MSLEWVRRSSRLVAAVLLVTSMLQFPHPSLDDEVCSPVAEEHDESKHVFTPDTQTPDRDHCAICHWLRWMNPAFSPGPPIVADLNPRTEPAAMAGGVLRAPSADRLPPRAPPVL